jgi:orotate phosphoribosyltransferase
MQRAAVGCRALGAMEIRRGGTHEAHDSGAATALPQTCGAHAGGIIDSRAHPMAPSRAGGRDAVHDDQLAFINLALARNALRFGHFTLKSGRESPYFFNAGLFSDGEAAAILGRSYAAALIRSGIQFDMLFGPAYKGIPLVTATAIALSDTHRRSVPYAFNRKEAKEHGEGGNVVGSPLGGRVVIVDDVIAAGTAKREAIDLIRAAGATPVAVLLALDRQERGLGELSAAQELEAEHGIRCVSILTLASLVEALGRRKSEQIAVSEEQLTALRAYQKRYGVR